MSNEEQILVVPAKLAIAAINSCNHVATGGPSTDGLHHSGGACLSMLQEQAVFVPRSPAEDDPSMKQLIVYALVAYQGSILCYKRGKVGQEPRLHAKRSIGVGGHINPEDWDLGATGEQAFRSALTRELQEEVGISAAHIDDVAFLGLVNEDQTDVGRVHLGLVYLVNLGGTKDLKFEDALVDPQWFDEEQVLAEENLELWSSIIRDSLYKEVKAAKERPAYQERVIQEEKVVAEMSGALQERRDRLDAFIASVAFDSVYVEERDRLTRQRDIMTNVAAGLADLSVVLRERISAFP